MLMILWFEFTQIGSINDLIHLIEIIILLLDDSLHFELSFTYQFKNILVDKNQVLEKLLNFSHFVLSTF